MTAMEFWKNYKSKGESFVGAIKSKYDKVSDSVKNTYDQVSGSIKSTNVVKRVAVPMTILLTVLQLAGCCVLHPIDNCPLCEDEVGMEQQGTTDLTPDIGNTYIDSEIPEDILNHIIGSNQQGYPSQGYPSVDYEENIDTDIDFDATNTDSPIGNNNNANYGQNQEVVGGDKNTNTNNTTTNNSTQQTIEINGNIYVIKVDGNNNVVLVGSDGKVYVPGVDIELPDNNNQDNNQNNDNQGNDNQGNDNQGGNNQGGNGGDGQGDQIVDPEREVLPIDEFVAEHFRNANIVKVLKLETVAGSEKDYNYNGQTFKGIKLLFSFEVETAKGLEFRQIEIPVSNESFYWLNKGNYVTLERENLDNEYIDAFIEAAKNIQVMQ